MMPLQIRNLLLEKSPQRAQCGSDRPVRAESQHEPNPHPRDPQRTDLQGVITWRKKRCAGQHAPTGTLTDEGPDGSEAVHLEQACRVRPHSRRAATPVAIRARGRGGSYLVAISLEEAPRPWQVRSRMTPRPARAHAWQTEKLLVRDGLGTDGMRPTAIIENGDIQPPLQQPLADERRETIDQANTSEH
jgi:hypothetical protein